MVAADGAILAVADPVRFTVESSAGWHCATPVSAGAAHPALSRRRRQAALHSSVVGAGTGQHELPIRVPLTAGSPAEAVRSAVERWERLLLRSPFGPLAPQSRAWARSRRPRGYADKL